MSFTIGADIEVFAKDKTGKHVSLCGLIGGTKGSPSPMKGADHRQLMVQEDNVSLEFNIPICYTEDQLIYYLTEAESLIKKNYLGPLGFEISDACAVMFDKDQLLHPQALIFGCEPDYNAWKMVENKKPKCDYPQLRTAGGHIHIGCDENMVEVIRWMDFFVGVPSILWDKSPGAKLRRELYGKAGAMRPKPYGEEYRVPSNFWMFSEENIKRIYNGTAKAIKMVKHKNHLTRKEGLLIQEIINTGDEDAAKSFCDSAGIAY